jgi:hypothetical protein
MESARHLPQRAHQGERAFVPPHAIGGSERLEKLEQVEIEIFGRGRRVTRFFPLPFRGEGKGEGYSWLHARQRTR